MNTVIIYVILGCFLLFGSFFVLFGLLVAWDGLRSKSWPTTVGKVLRSGIDTEVREAAGRRHMLILHGAKIVYEYEVGGDKYTANTVQSNNPSVSPRQAQRIANRYTVGSEVLVYYNPADPKDAVLKPGLPPGLWKLFAVFGPFFVVGLCGILGMAGLLRMRISQADAVLIVGIPIVLIGVWLTWMAVQNLRFGFASRHWPTTEGRIATSIVRQTQVGRSSRFEPIIVYQYTVADTPYAHSAISLGPFSGNCGEVVARYPVGATVTVFHDPVHPERAVLEPGIRWSNLFPLAFGLSFIAVATALVVLLRFMA